MATETTPSKPIHVFRAGRHITYAGEAIEFTQADLAAAAAAYDPALHEAPLVIGHPKTDAPAYGWAKGLSVQGDNLFVLPHQVNPEFAEMVKIGAFKKRSLKWYRPTDPANPKPGVWYPQHVGFLGATPPAIKGLREVELSESADLVEVEFGEWEDRTIARMFRRMREFFIGKYGQDEADKAIDGFDVDALLVESGRDASTESFLPAPAFAEATLKETHEVTPEQKATLEAENTQLKQQLAAREAADKAAAVAARHTAAVQFAEGLVAEGKVLPAEKAGIVAVLELVSTAPAVEFAEGDKTVTVEPAQRLQDFLKALPKRVEFGEVAKPAGAAKAVEFAAPSGHGVDVERLDTHNKALEYQAAHPGTEYIAAVKAVS